MGRIRVVIKMETVQIQYDNKSKHEYKEVFESEVYSRFSPEGKVVIDVGATAGEYALWAVSKGAKFVYAFEPNINSYKRMMRNIVSNNFVNVIQPFSIALSDDKYLNGEWQGDWFVKGKSNFTRIPSTLLDDFGIQQVDLMKIDVEGFELNVLKGAKNTIIQTKCKLIIELEGDESKEVGNFLKGLGYVQVDKVQNEYNPITGIYYYEYKPDEKKKTLK